jgi:hypothetical protein
MQMFKKFDVNSKKNVECGKCHKLSILEDAY